MPFTPQLRVLIILSAVGVPVLVDSSDFLPLILWVQIPLVWGGGHPEPLKTNIEFLVFIHF